MLKPRTLNLAIFFERIPQNLSAILTLVRGLGFDIIRLMKDKPNRLKPFSQ